MPSDPVLLVESVRFAYGAVVALADVSLRINRPSLFALLGPNGSGKSTLFKILSGLLLPQAGRVEFAGADMVTRRREVLARIGVVFQKPSLDTKLTAIENIVFHGQLYGLHGQSLRKNALELLSRFGVADRSNSRVDTLSGGLQRRVELAKCLIHSPSVLILDEPSTGLDPAARARFVAHLRDLCVRDGVTSLMTTHLLDDAEACDVVAIMDAGRILAMDEPLALRATISGDVIMVRARAADRLAKLITDRFGCDASTQDDIIRIEQEKGQEFLPQLIEAFPGEIEGVSVAKPTLGDVFLRKTGHRLDAVDGAVDSR